MGLLVLLVLALAAVAAIWRFAGLDRAGAQLVAAALLLAGLFLARGRFRRAKR